MKEKLNVLIVEDEAINRQILNKICSTNYNVIEACNGAEAWRILNDEKNDISAILLDIMMPVMNGYELLNKIRQAGMTELPIIVMTGESDSESEIRALDAGAWDFISKPYNTKVLLSRLKNAVARRQVSIYEKMQKMAAHDPLTGLHNRARTFSSIKEMIQVHPEIQFVFLRFDIDHFALYNSAFGEEEGDKLLCYLARKFEEIAKLYELVCYGRLNADVFCVCIPYGGNEENIVDIVNQTQKDLATYRSNYLLEISVGVYVINDPNISVEECYLRATMGAEQCKNQVGKHIGYYDEKSTKQAALELKITSEMQQALLDENFVIYLQPKFGLENDKVCGAEALVRWNHPQEGLISPGIFIPVFERNGFIAKLDFYVWDKTCAIIKEWLDQGKNPYPVSVNISRISLYNPQLVEIMIKLIEKYHFSPSYLQLEITESAYMTNPELLQKTIHGLRKAGFTILMDDFGSGYSSLNTLKEIEVDILKIDMKFLPVGDEMEKGEIILASVIKMANWLGMKVVVEGVETRRQRDFLEGVGCDWVQGYFYCKPIPTNNYTQKYLESFCEEANEIEIEEKENSEKTYSTILVIDDDEMDRDLIYHYFHPLYHVYGCSSAEDGLIYLKRNAKNVRLILIDNMMPQMSGLEFLAYCKNDSQLQSIPRIMMTANSQVQDQVEAFQLGAYDYITKPLVKEVVVARVNHVMNITQQYLRFEDAESTYRDLADKDELTGLLNQSAFQETTNRYLENYPSNHLAYLVFEVDDYEILKNKGPEIVQKMMKKVAEVLVHVFRKTDIIGRYGVDQFSVVMTGITGDDVARRKADEVVKTVTLDCIMDLECHVTLSAGIAFRDDTSNLDVLIARADQALYNTKISSKVKTLVYGEKIEEIGDNDKPIVLICGEHVELYQSLALGYGPNATFACVQSLEDLNQIIEKYQKRISVICLDMQDKVRDENNEFINRVLCFKGNRPLLAVCEEGNMDSIKQAVELPISDLLTLPPQLDVLQRRISKAIEEGRKIHD